MKKLAVEILSEDLPLRPSGLLSEAALNHLVNFGLSGFYNSAPYLPEGTELPAASVTAKDVFVIGRVVLIDGGRSATLFTAESDLV